MKIIQNTLKKQKFLRCPKKFRVGSKKVGSVGFPEMRHFFFFCAYARIFVWCELKILSLEPLKVLIIVYARICISYLEQKSLR